MISKCSTMVLSKSKFSEFEPLPDGADLDNVFLAGYTSDEDGTTYNVKVQASKIVENKTPNLIYELNSEDCNNRYKWINVEARVGSIKKSINVCEFNTADYSNYIEIKTLGRTITDFCPDNTLYLKLPNNHTPGTEFTIFIRDLEPKYFNKISLCNSSNITEEVCNTDTENRWGCIFKVLVSSDNTHLLTKPQII